MPDFNPSCFRLPRAALAMSEAMDAALERESAAQAPRAYLGASAIGEPCSRKIQYGLRSREAFNAKSLRIFERGHDGEARAVRHMRLAGFVLKTEGDDGRPLGFRSGAGRYRGHVDGVILEAPLDGFQTPALWEHKEVGDKGFKRLQSSGVRKAYPHYHDQLTQYQAYLDLTNPAVFMATNANTQERYIELVKFDRKRAQEVTDKAVRILEAEAAGELLPRPYADDTGFGCRFCAHREVCWDA